MRKKLTICAAVGALMAMPLISLAQNSDATVDTTVNTSVNGVENQLQTEVRIESKEKARELLESRRQELIEKRDAVREEIKLRAENLKGEMEQKREDVRNQVEERRVNAIAQIRDRLNNFIDKIIERFNAAATRLDKLAERIESRIAKIKENGRDTGEAEELMAKAKILIETAKAGIEEIELEGSVAASDTTTSTATVKADFEDLRETVNKAKADLKVAHAALIEVVRSLKIEN